MKRLACLAILAASACLPLEDALDGASAIGPDLDVGGDTQVGTAVDTDVLDVDVEADTGPAGPRLHPRFDSNVDDFFATPWPSDARVLEDGSPDLGLFPGADEGLMRTFREAIEGHVFGFSTMPVVYIAFEEELSRISLPAPATTLRPGSVAQLIDISDEGCGQRIPILLGADDEGDPFRAARTLAASPVPGFTLEPSTRYAFVLRREFGLDIGHEIAPPEEFLSGLAGEGPRADGLAALARCLEEDELDLASVGVATVFTTQDPAFELQALRAHVVSDAVDGPTVGQLEIDPELTREEFAETWRGSYQTPIYQAGVSPYSEDGGFVFDDGTPVVQRLEEVPFAVSIPAVGEAPYPVIVQMPGTGGTIADTIARSPSIDALQAGFAVATFAPQFHDTRAVPGSDPIVHGFNYLNPTSGRSAFRQQAIDTSYFVRVLREAVAESEIGDQLDISTLLYGGHSQGGLVGGLIAGVESEFAAYVLNGTGSYISVTIVERTDPIDIQGLIEQFFAVGRPIDTQHPLVALVQLGTDVVEPHAFTRLWRGSPGREAGAHVYVVNGLLDHTTFPRSMNALTISAGLAPIAPAGWDVDPYDVWDAPSEVELPIEGNSVSFGGDPLTMVTFLDAEEGHFTLQRNERAMEIAVSFWRQALSGVPRVE